jgi:hypothetical protein
MKSFPIWNIAKELSCKKGNGVCRWRSDSYWCLMYELHIVWSVNYKQLSSDYYFNKWYNYRFHVYNIALKYKIYDNTTYHTIQRIMWFKIYVTQHITWHNIAYHVTHHVMWHNSVSPVLLHGLNHLWWQVSMTDVVLVNDVLSAITM